MVGAVCGVGKIRSIVREFVSIAGENMSIVVGRAAWCAFGHRDWGRVFAWRSRSFIQKTEATAGSVCPLCCLWKRICLLHDLLAVHDVNALSGLLHTATAEVVDCGVG